MTISSHEHYRTWDEDSVSPNLNSPLFAEHLARYLFVSQFCKGKRVLDLGCGKGYGSYALAHVADSVLGVDLNEESLNFAREHYSMSRLEFLKQDATNPQFKPLSYDVIVSFEVLEHLPQSQVKNYLDAIGRLLSKTGIFIVSTPNHTVVTKSGMPVPDFHIFNLSPQELRKLLKDHFKEVELWGQAKRQGVLKDLILDFDFLNLRHSQIVKRMRSMNHSTASDSINADDREIWKFSDGWGEAKNYRFSRHLWRQAGCTLAICRQPL